MDKRQLTAIQTIIYQPQVVWQSRSHENGDDTWLDASRKFFEPLLIVKLSAMKSICLNIDMI